MPPLPPRSENLSHLPNPCARVKFIQDAKVLVDKARPEVDHVKRRVMGVNTPMQVHNGEGRLEPYLYVFVALAGLPGKVGFHVVLELAFARRLVVFGAVLVLLLGALVVIGHDGLCDGVVLRVGKHCHKGLHEEHGPVQESEAGEHPSVTGLVKRHGLSRGGSRLVRVVLRGLVLDIEDLAHLRLENAQESIVVHNPFI